MSNYPHYFIAIPLPASLKDHLSKWQDDIQLKVAYKTWYHKQDLHITLKFLGPVAVETLKQLQKELHVIEQQDEFSLEIGTLGTFGNPRSPRVLWAGVENTAKLALLQQMVEECAVQIGFEKENREYCPHITLAKKWAGGTADTTIAELIKEYHEKETFEVNEVVIYQIFPSRNPKYEVVQLYKLGKC
ncbi:RNA 2',3'-cyclic phosphodiesterase [Schinkia sp. CFF1]